MEELQNIIRSWSGFEIEGETKQELKESLSTVRDQLINEIWDRARKYEKIIDNLDVPEGN